MLELDGDDGFQRAQWRVQRVAWGLLALVPVAALAGLFGGGLVSERTIESPVARASYERFARREARTTMLLRVHSPPTNGETLRVALDTSFARALQLVDVVPTPLSMRSAGDAVELSFAVDPASGPATVHFESRPRRWGRLEGTIAVNGVALPPLHLFIWP